jgi:hypothetical protein
MVRVSAFEKAAPGFITVMLAVPEFAMSVAGWPQSVESC